MQTPILDVKTNLQVKIHKSITELDENAWDAVSGKNRILCSRKFVETLENSGFGGERCYYLVVYDGADIVAHSSAYIMNTEMDLCARGAVRRNIDLVRRKWKDFFVLRSLECGPPISTGNSISFKNGEKRAEVLGILCEAMEDLAKSLGAGLVLFRDFYNDEKVFYDFLKIRGYKELHNLPTAELKIRWKTFNEYLDSMHSNYRRKIIKRMDKCAKENIRIEVVRNFSENTRELKHLYDNVYDQAKEIRRERLPESFFQNLNKYLGEKAVIVSAVKDQKIIGYMLLLFNGKTLISKFPGLDYDCNREYYTYFNLFYKSIELAIESGMDCFDMGITTLAPKKDMGADIVPLTMYMKHFNPVFNEVIPTIFNKMTRQDTEPRNVFK